MEVGPYTAALYGTPGRITAPADDHASQRHGRNTAT